MKVKKCKAKTKQGPRCAFTAVIRGFCLFHLPGNKLSKKDREEIYESKRR